MEARRHRRHSLRFDPGAGVNAYVNIGRGASFGLSNTIANWISPGASCTVAGNSFDEFLGGTGTSLVGGEFLSGLTAPESEAGIDGTTAALQEHLAGAVERFNVEGLTEAQQSALVDNPGLEQAFRGQRIDTFFKESLNNTIESGTDPRVANLYVTRSGELGPDVFDLGGMNHWWDVTTPGS